MRNLLLSTVITLLMVPAASFATSDFTTHTHTDTPMELKSILQLNNSFKTAAVCFLGSGDCGDGSFISGDSEYKIDTKQQCKNEGFTLTSCSLPAYPDVQCPYNNAYYAKCTGNKPRACKESGYTETSCPDGYVTDKICPYDSSYKRCKCNPCDGYDYTYAQATAQGYVTDGSCQSCSATKYKRKNNPCTGYSTCECGGATGATTCYSATTQKFNSCKSCCSDICSLGWTDTICPSWASKASSGKTECGNTCYVCQSEGRDDYEITVTLGDYDIFPEGCWCYLLGDCYPGHSVSVWEHHDSGCPDVCTPSKSYTCERTYTYMVQPLNH